MIIQGSNNPLVITFDASVADISQLTITLWCDRSSFAGSLIKTWTKADMTVDDDTVICPLTQEETAEMPAAKLMLEAKGLDENDNTIFWDACEIDVKRRRDKGITLTRTEA